MEENKDVALTLMTLLINATGAEFEDEQLALDIITETLDKNKICFIDWVSIATVYDSNGFYLYRNELWSIEDLEKMYYKEYLKL